MTKPSEITRLLDAWTAGEPGALDHLMPLIFEDVRGLARKHLSRESLNHTLQPTALVGEVYLRLHGKRTVHWENRQHFFASLAGLIRRILVDHARRKIAEKRGGSVAKQPLADALVVAEERPDELVALDDALKDLAKLDPRKAEIVHLSYFGGLGQGEIADLFEISVNTVQREWTKAKMWLRGQLASGGKEEGDEGEST